MKREEQEKENKEIWRRTEEQIEKRLKEIKEQWNNNVEKIMKNKEEIKEIKELIGKQEYKKIEEEDSLSS